jgi:transposase
MTQTKQLDFNGQKIFCGVDVHKKSWKVCIRSEHMELKTFTQNPSAAELSRHLRTNYPSAEYQVVYEAGFCGFTAQREFTREGIHCLIVHPADVPTNDKERLRKSDTVDCRKLSRALSDKEVQGIYIPGLEQQDDRAVLRTYQQFAIDQTRCKNRIKSWLFFQGVSIPDEKERAHWSKNYIQWLKELSLTPSARISLDLSIRHYEQTREMVLAALGQLRTLSRQERYKTRIEQLRTIPGIGEIAALLFTTEIGDINRFRSFDCLCDYVGLVPKVNGSGERETVSGLTHRGHHQLRETLIEASWTAIRYDPALTMAYNELTRTMKKNKAIIKIARKVLNRIRFVMKNQKPYVIGVVQ